MPSILKANARAWGAGVNTVVGIAGCLGTAAMCLWIIISALRSGRMVQEFGPDYTRADKPVSFWSSIVLLAVGFSGSLYLLGLLIRSIW